MQKQWPHALIMLLCMSVLVALYLLSIVAQSPCFNIHVVAEMGILQSGVTVVQPVMVKQDMVSAVHTDLGMEVVDMTEDMMTEHMPHVMCTTAGVQHQLVKQHTPGLALSATMDALQHEQQGLMIGQQAACLRGSKQHTRYTTDQRSTSTTAAVHMFVNA